MADAPTPELPPLDDAAYQRALAIVLDTGVAITVELKPASPTIPVTQRAAAFDRVSAAIRHTILLSKHIADGALVQETKQVLARKQVIRTVQDQIERNARPEQAHALRLELLERIDAPEFLDDIANRSPGELIVELCRDLGIANPLMGAGPIPRRTPDDIAILCAQAAARPSSGLPQWLAATEPQAAANDAEARIRLKES